MHEEPLIIPVIHTLPIPGVVVKTPVFNNRYDLPVIKALGKPKTIEVPVNVVNTPPIPIKETIPENIPIQRIAATPIVANRIQPQQPGGVRELVLRPWQLEWSRSAYEILLRSHVYIDTSPTGCGKTIVGLWLARQFGFRVLVVCPVSVIETWRTKAAEYGVGFIGGISYQSLSSIKNHQPSHGYLQREDIVTDGGMHQVNFTPTQLYLDLLNQGVMVIFDEMQKIKNTSVYHKACTAMVRPIIAGGGRSRFGLLSGSPFDKETHATNLLKFIGYIRATRLYNYREDTRALVLEGIQELIDACMFLDPDETERILENTPPSRSNMNNLCYTLYVRVVKRNISGSMPRPPDSQFQNDIKNGFYNISPQRMEELREAINTLATAVNFENGRAAMNQNNIGSVTMALRRIENAKADDMARVALSILTNVPNSKVIIAVNYNTTIDLLHTALRRHRPLVMNGKTSAPTRGTIKRSFNSDVQHRILIMNTQVGGIGIDLHDTEGDSPRFMIISPSYHMLDIIQASGRIYRDGVLSDATIRIFYGKDGAAQETAILNALARKSTTLRGTLETNNNTILPGDYPTYTEP